MPHATSKCEKMNDFLKLHRVQLESSGIPEKYWKTLFVKMKNERFDAGESFMIQQVQETDDYDDEEAMEDGDDSQTTLYSWQVVAVKEGGIKQKDPQHIYLIDHAWTYRVDHTRKQLETVPGLLARMASLMDIPQDDRNTEEIVEEVLREMWKYNQTYNLGNAQLGTEDAVPIWYVMDEFGCRIQHGDSPNVKLVPFCYMPSQVTYTVMWPLTDITEGDELTRNYIEAGGSDTLIRKLRLLPWQPEDMTHLNYDLHEGNETFFMKYKVHESLPNVDQDFPCLPRDRNIKVFTDVDQVRDSLTDDRFELVLTEDEADIMWTRKYLRDFKIFSEETPCKMINQYPFEMVVTVKDLLAVVCRRMANNGKHIDHGTLNSSPDWLPTTFNLQTELPQFVSYFQQREEKGLDNHWICKPWNLARSLDSHVTDNLDYILRLPDTGPKIASKYVEEPVLFAKPGVGQVKFDLRYLVLVRSVEPLTLCVHRKFVIRFANKVFSLDHLDDYEKHFTVMNYKPGTDMTQLPCDEFIEEFESQYPNNQWTNIEESIHDVIRQLFVAAVSQPPPMGIGHSPQSRAVYGVDVMLKWKNNSDGVPEMKPVLFECNFGPDTHRLSVEYPDFWNEVFAALFFEDFTGAQIAAL